MHRAGRAALLLLFLAQVTGSQAQYALTEAGPLVTAGLALPVGSENVRLGLSAGVGGFFTHYRCGKRDGFWLELQARYFQVSDDQPDTATLAFPTPPAPGAAALNYSFVQLDGGIYYKIRIPNYHRPRELALLVGPKFSYRLLAQADGETFESDTYREVKRGYIGAHLSVFYRLPAGKRYSYFVGAGGEYFFGDAVTTSADPRLRYAHLFVRFGYVLWNTR